MTNFVIHKNRWPWGDSYMIVSNDGYGVCHIGIEDNDPDVAYFSSISVHPVARNKGYATRLIRKAIEIAKNEGVREIEFDAVNEKWLIEWYMRLGFTKYGFTEDGLCKMKKFIR